MYVDFIVPGAKFNEGTWPLGGIDTSCLQFSFLHNGSLANMEGVQFPRATMVDDPDWSSKRHLFSIMTSLPVATG